MEHIGLVVVAFAFLAVGLASRKLAGSMITGPMIFTALGLLLGPSVLGVIDVEIARQGLPFIAELTLVMVLFTDASKIELRALLRDLDLPLRMLTVGMPLTILLGTGFAILLLPELGIWEAALLAAILTPTDAALGQAVVDDERIPERLRQTVSVESGLNDGIALPVVLLFAALAGADNMNGSDWLTDTAMQLVLGPLAGIAVGYTGGKLLALSRRREWMTEQAEGVCALSIAVGAFALAELVGGNGFIAAFTGGLAFGSALDRTCTFVYRFEETEVRLLVFATFGITGAVLLPNIMAHLTLSCLLFAIAALTLMRMVPITVSLLGENQSWPSIAFLGWFGPRGLASVLFLVLVMGRFELPNRELVAAAVIGTVTLSIVAHGISAASVARAYGSSN